MQEQSTEKLDDTTSKTAKLDFNRLKEKPRLSIKSNMDGGYRLMCANDQYFICCPASGFILIDKEGHEQKLDIKHDFSVSSICWSTYVQKFFILSNNQKIYTLDPVKQQLKIVKNLSDDSVKIHCICYEKILVLWPNDMNKSIEIYELSLSAATDDNEESIIKSLENPIQTPTIPPRQNEAHKETKQICFSSDGKYLGIVRYYFFFNYSDSGNWTQFDLRRFPRDSSETLEFERCTNIWDAGSWIIALPDKHFLVKGRSEGHLILLDYSRPRTTEYDPRQETEYHIESKISTFAICGNCLAIEGSEGEIHFYDL